MFKLLALDRFTLLLFTMVLLASFVPIYGHAADIFSVVTNIAIAILFFYMAPNYLVKRLFKASCIGGYMV